VLAKDQSLPKDAVSVHDPATERSLNG